MPEVTDEADGSQDALLVRVAAGGHVGWGECEAAPLPSIAAFVCPMSHGVCRPVGASILGQTLDGACRHRAHVGRRSPTTAWTCCRPPTPCRASRWRCGTCSGKARGEPVWKLLGYAAAIPRRPTPRCLFGDTPQTDTRRGKAIARARLHGGEIRLGTDRARQRGGRTAEHFVAAREGLGPDGILLVDVGQIFIEDVARAAERLPALEAAGAIWLEEPFEASAYEAYGALAKRSSKVKLAGGEGAHNVHMARHLIDYGGVGFIQIDCGRIGGIGPAKEIADYASARGVTFVNHTFTSHLALSASLQPYAGLADHRICEYPAAPSPSRRRSRANKLARDGNGEIRAPDAPGLGIEIDAGGRAPISARRRDQGWRQGPLPHADDWLKPGAARSCGADLRLWHPGSFGRGKCLLCRSRRCCGGREFASVPPTGHARSPSSP